MPSESARTRGPKLEPANVTAASSSNAGCVPYASSARASAPNFLKLYEGAVSSVAIGKAGRAAIVARPNAKLFDGTEWRAIEPALLDNQQVEIFFGRDNQPRLLGFREAPSNALPEYRRHVRGRWQAAPEELGRLGTARTAFYGVLGHEDPEVVCAVAEVCIVKRLSGWGTAAAHPELARLRLLQGSVWALRSRAVERLQKGLWEPLLPHRDWDRPSALWVDGAANVFVVEAEANTLYRLVAGKWEGQTSPVPGPRALWGRSPSDVWLAGDGGVAHFDGSTWSCLPNLPGPFDAITQAVDDLWFSGKSGIFSLRSGALGVSSVVAK